MSDGSADSLGGHPRQTPVAGDDPCDLAVRHRLSERDGQHDLPDGFPERTRPHIQGRRESRIASAEVNVQPSDGFPKDRRGGFFRAAGSTRIC